MLHEIICIVEGHGDAVAVPILLRRIAFAVDQSIEIRCRSWRRPKTALLKPRGLETDIEMSAGRYPQASGILILIDADKDCPARLGAELLNRASSTRPDLKISVVIAKCEFEAWFIAAIRSLSAHPDFQIDPATHRFPEEILGRRDGSQSTCAQENMLRPGIRLPSLN